MNGKTDNSQLQYATKEKRAILSFNIADYVELAHEWYNKGQEHYGIIVSPQIDLKNLIQLTTNLLRRVSSGQMRNHVDWLQNYQ